jgi:hypothetical protein
LDRSPLVTREEIERTWDNKVANAKLDYQIEVNRGSDEKNAFDRFREAVDKIAVDARTLLKHFGHLDAV